MKDVQKSEQISNAPNTTRFEHHKGYFILEFDCIITQNQIVKVHEKLQLVDFTNEGGMLLRDVVFWHALLKDNYLKIIAYDTKNNVVIQRLHDITKPEYHCDWVLLGEDVFEDDALEFEF